MQLVSTQYQLYRKQVSPVHFTTNIHNEVTAIYSDEWEKSFRNRFVIKCRNKQLLISMCRKQFVWKALC